ncbi:hypothetical protein ACQXZZ_03975 [Corynebacterium diphtheriae]|nr:hypothetical protein [Corynebacterium diphtheriae]AEX40877.1 hypothetical protein CD31A_0193 [Corynebacterium diphtheriae 31A]AWR14878.1 hypothetical protein B11Q_00160 [Corynebacterium diphtheriae]MBG9313416.1 hypothetical protein [Corynebacterium diphtheriae bv. mitis]MBN4654209.1 hypothetical protein [Corynebacterium diphtheriae bv. mitis]UJM21980.1 hypothetical protein FE377_00815 [Corynebacterium diphtheriae]
MNRTALEELHQALISEAEAMRTGEYFLGAGIVDAYAHQLREAIDSHGE